MQLKLTCTGCGRNVEISGEFGKDVPTIPCPACKTSLEIPPNILDVGDVIGGFCIEKHLGSGAMGSVYLAKQLSMDRQVAIKVMAKSNDLSERAADDFLKEIRLLGRLDHPNIVGAFEAGDDKDLYYVAMRYLQGETLERRIEREGPIEEKDALHIVIKLADALDCAWQKHNILHRDLKPDNVMLEKGGEPVLLDLGISKVQGTKTQHTISGQILGTPLYMSPEQARDSAGVDMRTDVYSLGCTLFHALTGHVPFDAPDVVGVLMKHSLDPVPVNDLSEAGISESCIEFVQQMMAKNPDDRFDSWTEVISQAKRVLRGEVRKKPKKRPPSRARNVSRKTKPKQNAPGRPIALIVFAVLAILGFTALVYSSMDEPSSSSAKVAPPPKPPTPPPQEFPSQPTPTNQLPPGWELAKVGEVKGGATATYGNRKLTIESCGKDLWDKADDFALVHKRVSGNFIFTARVDSFTGDHEHAMAGIMVREATRPESRYAAVFTKLDGTVEFKRRREDNTATLFSRLPKPMKKPTWVRLYRRGDNVHCYASTDKRMWHPLGSINIRFGNSAQIGFFVCSHIEDKSAKAVFSNLRLSRDADETFIYRLVLVQAGTAKYLEHLRDGDGFNLRKTGRRLSIRADVTGPEVGSVQILHYGRQLRIENREPYYLASDSGDGKPFSWTPKTGEHTVTAVPWTGKAGKGRKGESLQITFNVED